MSIDLCRCHQGRVKPVSENYTRNLTPPTEGFDCHVSEQFPTVSAKTSSFLAFERAQVRWCTWLGMKSRLFFFFFPPHFPESKCKWAFRTFRLGKSVTLLYVLFLRNGHTFSIKVLKVNWHYQRNVGKKTQVMTIQSHVCIGLHRW